jgi:hypothetical protein
VPISALAGRGSEPQTDFRKRPKTLLVKDKSGKHMLIHKGKQSLIGPDTILTNRNIRGKPFNQGKGNL